MKKVSKKALEDAFKKHFLLGSDFIGVSTVYNLVGKVDRYYVTFKEYQVTLFVGSYGLSGWFSGLLNFARLEEVLKVVKSFNED